MTAASHEPVIRLREAMEADEAFIDKMNRPDIAGPYNHFDDPADEQVHGGDLGAGRMIIELADSTPVGDVGFFAVPYGPNRRSLAWKIGITILPEHRGRGYGAAGQRLLADHLFATTVSNRVEADTDIENVPEQRALERAGFIREGILRGAQHRNGTWHDLVIYARIRTDP